MQTCPQCQSDMPATHKYCGHCGMALDVMSTASDPATARPADTDTVREEMIPTTRVDRTRGMVVCTHCSRLNRGDVAVCAECGAELERPDPALSDESPLLAEVPTVPPGRPQPGEVRCTSCHLTSPDKFRFCRNCGKPLPAAR